MDFDAALVGLAIKNDGNFKKAKELLRDGFLLKRGVEAWAFVQKYLQEYGSLPSDLVVQEHCGMAVPPLDGVDISWVVDQMAERNIFRSLEYGLGEAQQHLEAGHWHDSVEEVNKLHDHLKNDISQQVRLYTLADVVPEVRKLYEDTKNGVTGVPFPWPSMTAMTMGMWPGTLTFFVSRPGMGKSWTLVIIAWAACFESKLKVLLVSPEMNRVEMAERFVVKHGSFNYGDVVSAKLGKFAEPVFFKTIDDLKEGEGQRLFILDDEDKLEPGYIEDAIEAIDPDLIGIDSLYMLRVAQKKVKSGPGSKGGRYDRIIDTVDWLRTTSRRTKKPFVAISQLSREGKVKKGAKEQIKKGISTGGLEDALAMSDTILWDVHNLFALFQDDDMKLDRQMMYVPLKIRRQAKWSGVVTNWNMDEMDFNEIGTKVLSSKGGDDFQDKGHDLIY